MEFYSPKYYNSFKCIADKCKHSCCVGWEIDIDSDTYEFYKTLDCNIDKKIINNISSKDGVFHFVLDENERCPFLNKNNLCDIVSNLGDDALCQICRDHPRFRNYFSNRIEIGLGLCCEEAARIILTNREEMQLVKSVETTENFFDDEIEFFNMRNKLFNILNNRKNSLNGRIAEMFNYMDIKPVNKTFNEWINFYLSLEILDESWVLKLKNNLGKNTNDCNFHLNSETIYEQLIIYFLYRHLSDGIYDDSLKARIAFSVHAALMIKNICNDCDDICEIIDISRQYSSEIEYSEENIEKILKELNN